MSFPNRVDSMNQTSTITETQTGCGKSLFRAISAPFIGGFALGDKGVTASIGKSEKAQISLTLLEKCRDLSGLAVFIYQNDFLATKSLCSL